MDTLTITRHGPVATLTLARGKVNAIDPVMVDELTRTLADLARDPAVGAVVITGRGSFFSFGWDVPLLYPFSREEFAGFVTDFTRLYADLFSFPKPVVAALNGHAIAGGCMLALACDRRVMVPGKSKIALNEITFGASLPAGSVAMLRFVAGDAGARRIAESGEMFSAEQGHALGLVDRVVPESELMAASLAEAEERAAKPAAAYAGVKALLRKPALEEMAREEERGIGEFVAIWYSDETRARLRNIVIR